MSKSKDIVVFDIDGCLADYSERVPLVEAGMIDEFYSLVLSDKPISQGVWLAQAFLRDDNIDVKFVTGRPESCRSDTVEWLRRNVDPFICGKCVIMRKNLDISYVGWKVGAVKSLKNRIRLVVDDDAGTVQDFVNMGIPALHFRHPTIDLVSLWANRDGYGQIVKEVTGIEATG